MVEQWRSLLYYLALKGVLTSVGTGTGQVHCDVLLYCTLSPAGTVTLPPGNHTWKIQDDGAYGYINWTAPKYFTIP